MKRQGRGKKPSTRTDAPQGGLKAATGLSHRGTTPLWQLLQGGLAAGLAFIVDSVLQLTGQRCDICVLVLLAFGAFWIGYGVCTSPRVAGLTDAWKRTARTAVAVVMSLLLFVAVRVVLPEWLVSRPFQLMASASEGNYQDGASIDGIDWLPGLSELRVYIGNETDADYDNVEVEVRLDR